MSSGTSPWMWSLVGGKFERSLITHAVKEDKGKLERIVIGEQARIQMA